MMRRSIFTAALAVITVSVILSAAAPPAYCQYHEEDKWEERHNKAQPADKVMDAIGVVPGMTIAEIGAGRGRYAVQMAERVGEKGRVYANDISADDLAYLRERCERDGIGNIETILGEVTDPRLPEGKFDLSLRDQFVSSFRGSGRSAEECDPKPEAGRQARHNRARLGQVRRRSAVALQASERADRRGVQRWILPCRHRDLPREGQHKHLHPEKQVLRTGTYAERNKGTAGDGTVHSDEHSRCEHGRRRDIHRVRDHFGLPARPRVGTWVLGPRRHDRDGRSPLLRRTCHEDAG